MHSIRNVVIRFSGDSGDGMQLTGSEFANTSALFGNDVSTFPNFPAEIRAPQGSVYGVSGFQVQIGNNEVNTAGDAVDVCGRRSLFSISTASSASLACSVSNSSSRIASASS